MSGTQTIRVLLVALGAGVLVTSASIGVTASAGAQNPCSYSVNYGCRTTTSSVVRHGRTGVTSAHNYARDTDSRRPVKTVGWWNAEAPVGERGGYITGDSDVVAAHYPRFRGEVYCYEGGGVTGVVVGCNYTS